MTISISRRFVLVLVLGLAAACGLPGPAGAALSVTPTSLNFGNIQVGGSATRQVTIAETSSSSSQILATGFPSGADFSASLEAHYVVDGVVMAVEVNPTLPLALFRYVDVETGQVEQQLAVAKVTFAPGTAGSKTDQYQIGFGGGASRTVFLYGTALSPPPSVPLLPQAGLLLLGLGLAGAGLAAMRA